MIECHFLQPTHNKQDFDDTDKYRCTIKCIDFELPTFYNVPFKIAITVLSPTILFLFYTDSILVRDVLFCSVSHPG